MQKANGDEDDFPQNPCHHSHLPCGGEITNKTPSCSLGFLLGCSLVRPGLHPPLAARFLRHRQQKSWKLATKCPPRLNRGAGIDIMPRNRYTLRHDHLP